VTAKPSRVEVLYELFQRVDLVTYEQAGEALGLHPEEDRKIIRDAMRQLRKKLLAKDGRALRAVTNVGYRVAASNEHVTLARERKKRAGIQMTDGLDILTGTDLAGLSYEAKELVLAERANFARAVDYIRSMEQRQQRTEAAVEEIKGQVDRTAEETAEVKARLSRLEGKDDGDAGVLALVQ
jgi:hypothetical protein